MNANKVDKQNVHFSLMSSGEDVHSDNIFYFNGSYKELEKFINEKNCLCVIDLFDVWCGPCRKLGENLPEFAKKYPSVPFIKIDIAKNEEISNKFEVMFYPHISYVKPNNGEIQIVGTVIGNHLDEIQEKLISLI